MTLEHLYLALMHWVYRYYWRNGMTEEGNIGMIECWNNGILAGLNMGKMESELI